MNEYCYQIEEDINRLHDLTPDVPDYFTVNPKILTNTDIDEQTFIKTFGEFVNLVKQIYRDMMKYPESYGLPLFERHSIITEAQKVSSKKSAIRLVEILRTISAIGVLNCNNDSLEVDIITFKSAKISKYAMIFDCLFDFGFNITNYKDGKFEKSASLFSISHSDNPMMMNVIKLFMQEAPWGTKNNDYQTRQLDYKLAADKEKLSSDAFIRDFAAYASNEVKDKIVLMHNQLINQFHLDCAYEKGSEYIYRHDNPGVRLAELKLRVMPPNKPNRYNLSLKLLYCSYFEDKLNTLPEHIKKIFRQSNCRFCNSDGECVSSIRYKFEEQNVAKCYMTGFYLTSAEDVDTALALINYEYEARGNNWKFRIVKKK